jgi:hypothetical protein
MIHVMTAHKTPRDTGVVSTAWREFRPTYGRVCDHWYDTATRAAAGLPQDAVKEADRQVHLVVP